MLISSFITGIIGAGIGIFIASAMGVVSEGWMFGLIGFIFGLLTFYRKNARKKFMLRKNFS